MKKRYTLEDGKLPSNAPVLYTFLNRYQEAFQNERGKLLQLLRATLTHWRLNRSQLEF